MQKDRAAKGLQWLGEDIHTLLKKKTVKKHTVKFRYKDISTIVLTTVLALVMLWVGMWLLL